MQCDECNVMNIDDNIDNINDVRNNNKMQYYECNAMNAIYERQTV